MPAIRAEGLGVRFQFDRHRRVITPGRTAIAMKVTETWGLRHVSFSISAGEGVALIGATGSGKTTLLRAIGGILPADEGRLEIAGRAGSLLSIDAGLLPTLTGRENGLLLAVLAGLSRSEARRALESIKARSGLGDAFERPASSMSQGMRARLGFSTAEQSRPGILLLDEVHEAFDHRFREVLAARARKTIAAGGIVVAAGHDHEVLERLCSRALLLSEGRVVADGPFARVRREYLAAAESVRFSEL
jgi:ABC-type polysaccharide/polyol phosphate transport system ATPase subunit